MATYAIIKRQDPVRFDVEVTGRNDEPETMKRFETQGAAERWIVKDAKFNREQDRGHFRMQWRF